MIQSFVLHVTVPIVALVALASATALLVLVVVVLGCEMFRE